MVENKAKVQRKKKTRSICNENIDKFCCVKKIRFVFNENTDQFSVLEKSNLYLMRSVFNVRNQI